jgi:hypothetical protein
VLNTGATNSCGTNCVRFVVNICLRSCLINYIFLSEPDLKCMCVVMVQPVVCPYLRAALHSVPIQWSPTFGPEQGDHVSQ